MSNARKSALTALNEVFNNKMYADDALSSVFSRIKLNPKDKALTTELVYGTTRMKLTLDYYISLLSKIPDSKLDSNIKNILRLGLYQLEYLRIPEYAAVNSSVELAKNINGKNLSSFVNGILRSFLRSKDKLSFPDILKYPIEHLSVKYSHPKWMVKRWVENYGIENTISLLKYNNAPPPTCININTMKTSLKEVSEAFKKSGIDYKISETIPDCLILSHTGIINELPGYNEGHWYIQSETSSLISHLVNPSQDDFIVDLCAAPGTKTVAMAIKMNNTGRIIATDKNASRLTKIKENCYRLGVTNVESKKLDATTFAIRDNVLADKILIDAPCSNTGVLSRRADARWRYDESDLKKFAQTQSKIIENASHLIKPEGLILYSVCSIEPEEGYTIIQEFLDHHKDFSLIDLDKLLPPAYKTYVKSSTLTVLSFETQQDGFFVACVKKL